MFFKSDNLKSENFRSIIKQQETVELGGEATTDNSDNKISSKEETNKKSALTLYLLLCVFVVSSGSFQFGYNFSSLNPCTYLIKLFIKEHSFFFDDLNLELASLNGQETMNASSQAAAQIRNVRQANADRTEKRVEYFWAVLNGLFVIGGMLAAVSSKHLLYLLGQKRTLFCNNLFGVAGACLCLFVSSTKSPGQLMISRFLFGFQCGMLTCVSPIYLNEIAPPKLRVIISLNFISNII